MHAPTTNKVDNDMSSHQSQLNAITAINYHSRPYRSSLVVLAVAGLMAATTTFRRYITGYLIFEVVFLVWQRIIRAYIGVEEMIDRPSTSTPKLGLWKDILTALDDADSKGVDEWLGKVFGEETSRVRRENVEELLAGKPSSLFDARVSSGTDETDKITESIFNTPLTQLRADPLKYHALNQAVTELEIRGNSRFISGYNKDIRSLLSHVHNDPKERPLQLMLERLSQLVVSIVLHSLLFLVGFRSSSKTPSVLIYRSHKTSNNPNRTGSPVVLLGDSRSEWRMIPLVVRLRRSGDHPLYILKTPTLHDLAVGPDFSLNDILSQEDRAREPILLIDRNSFTLAAKLVRGSVKASIVLVDPSIDPLLMTALDSTIAPMARAADHEQGQVDISTLGSTGHIAHVILTPSMSTQESSALKRYCELKSIPFSSLLSTSPLDTELLALSDAITDTCRRLNNERTSTPSHPQSEATQSEITTPEDTPGGIPLVTLLAGTDPASMSTLENISSIGMCIAPPLRTRQRSKSLGSVVGYGHVDGIRRPSMVVAM